jgi:hypothetical protein
MGVLGAALLVPLLLAGSLGANLSRTASGLRRGSAFLMTRPMTSSGLAFAKFRMAFHSVLLTWGLVGVLTLLFVAATGLTAELVEVGRRCCESFPGWKGAAIGLLAVVAVPILTWKQFTGSLILRLSGRAWLIAVAELTKAAGILLAIGAGLWLYGHPDAVVRLRAALPSALQWLIGVLLAVKGCVAVWACRALLSRDLMGPRTVAVLVCGWFVAGVCLSGLIALVLPPRQLADAWPFLLPGVLAWVPLNRFALAPLALEHARHE